MVLNQTTNQFGNTEVPAREKEVGGSGGSLEPPAGPLLTHLHSVHMGYSESLPNLLTPERIAFSQVPAVPTEGWFR